MTISHNTSKTRLGQMFFSMMSHTLYDLGLYRLVSPFIWRCPTDRLLDNYVDNVSADHLEIGVGSGYFLERTLCADFLKTLTLMDLNHRCLHKSARRLRMFVPQLVQHNVLQPFAAKESMQANFNSVGMNYVLHCIPGRFGDLEGAFRHVHGVLQDGGVFFGATLVRQPFKSGATSWLFMKLLNAVGIFHNKGHAVDELRHVLTNIFRVVEIEMVGNVTVFRAVK